MLDCCQLLSIIFKTLLNIFKLYSPNFHTELAPLKCAQTTVIKYSIILKSLNFLQGIEPGTSQSHY